MESMMGTVPMHEYTVALIGNPNTGKSTVFNNLTGLRQHTGNWTGKTVGSCWGRYRYKQQLFNIVDLPGTYSISPTDLSQDEAAARDNLLAADGVTVIVADATSLARNLILALQVLDVKDNVILCLNMMDEAAAKGIIIDVPALSDLLGCPVVLVSAASGQGLSNLKEMIYQVAIAPSKHMADPAFVNYTQAYLETVIRKARDTADAVTSKGQTTGQNLEQRDRRLDRAILGGWLGVPLMLAMLFIVFWITIVGANYPSELLAKLFKTAESALFDSLSVLNAPDWFIGVTVTGMFRTLAWVVSVMLPPMAIFFPLFTLMEDAGFLPRIAFKMDGCFKCAGAHGKQALTMCMGLGCNAAGVTSCNIIESPRERLIAILTNSFIPCNGRFPSIILMATILAAGVTGIMRTTATVAVVFACVALAVMLTLAVSWVLSRTVLKGSPSGFILELPPYRRPRLLGVLKRSLWEKTVKILTRAVVVSAPAGIIIWILSNFQTGNVSWIHHMTDFFGPLAGIMGMDGVLLTAFILGLPANEIVMPIVLMIYTGGAGLISAGDTAAAARILTQNGWGFVNVLCALVFFLFHFPCATTLMTIKKETGSLKWTLAAFILPTLVGFLVCLVIRTAAVFMT